MTPDLKRGTLKRNLELTKDQDIPTQKIVPEILCVNKERLEKFVLPKKMTFSELVKVSQSDKAGPLLVDQYWYEKWSIERQQNQEPSSYEDYRRFRQERAHLHHQERPRRVQYRQRDGVVREFNLSESERGLKELTTKW